MTCNSSCAGDRKKFAVIIASVNPADDRRGVFVRVHAGASRGDVSICASPRLPAEPGEI